MDESERRNSGMNVRRRVLGSEHVDRSTAQMTPLTAEFQDLITRYAWGEVWTRPGLDVRSRRLSLVTYLIPGFALFYGAVLLDEPVTPAALIGLVLILAGVALASGERFLRSRAAAQEEPA